MMVYFCDAIFFCGIGRGINIYPSWRFGDEFLERGRWSVTEVSLGDGECFAGHG